MIYEPIYYPFYANGFENLPSQNTPVTADVLNGFEETIRHIEEFLANVDFDNIKKTIVEELPNVEEADTNTIYMIYVESVTGSDKYEQYMLIDGALVMIGDTSVDLTNYAKKEEVEKNKGDIAAIKKDVTELQNAEDITHTTDSILTNSYDGGIKINRIAGAVEQNGTPTPDAEAAIQNADFTEIKSKGKNLVPYPYYETTHVDNGIKWTDIGDGRIIGNGTTDTVSSEFTIKIRVNGDYILPAGNYILSGCPNVAGCQLNVGATSESTGSWEQIARDTGNEVTFTLDKDTVIAMNARIGAGYTVSDAIFKPMIRKADIEDDTWEPYKSSTAALAFTGRAIEVTADDDYTYEKDGKYYIADTIERVDSGYKKVQRRARHRLTSNEKGTFGYSSDVGTRRFALKTSGDDWLSESTGTGELCTHAIQEQSNNSNHGYFYISTQYCVFPDNDFYWADLDAFKKWVDENEVYIEYTLKEPIITKLSDEEAIALLSLKSFDTVTHISTDSELQPVIDLEYGTSKVGGYTLDALNTAQRSEIKENANAERLTALEALTTEVTTETEES